MDPALRTVIDSDLVRLHARALALVGSRRPAVEAIAGRLLRDRFLSSDEIRRVVADAERSDIVTVEGTTNCDACISRRPAGHSAIPPCRNSRDR
jgi:hypothetical protein